MENTNENDNEVSAQQMCSYLQSMTADLAQLARNAGMIELSILLSMATLEAQVMHAINEMPQVKVGRPRKRRIGPRVTHSPDIRH